MLTDLTITGFLAETAGNEPVPGGGSASALNAALAAALTEMVANLTIGKKNYTDVEENMKRIAARTSEMRKQFIQDIDRDSDAYDTVFQAFKLPKNTEEEKEIRRHAIEDATKVAALVPMEVAELAFSMMRFISQVTKEGNKNAVTDGCVAMMAARTAVLGALLNVRINLSSIKDEEFVKKLSLKADELENEAKAKEEKLLTWVKSQLG